MAPQYDFNQQMDEYRRMAQALTPSVGPMMGNGLFNRINPQSVDNTVGHIPIIGQHLAGGVNALLGGADRVADNAMLSAAMVPEARGPEGVGGGISRALQGVLGAGQYRRQMALQSAMLPYQMMGPQIDMMDKVAQMHQRNQLAQHYMAQDQFYQKRGEHYDAMEDLQQQKINNRPPTEAELDERIAYGMNPPKDPKNPTPSEYGQIAQNLNQIKARKGAGQGDGAITPAKMVMNAYGQGHGPNGAFTTEDWGNVADSYANFQAKSAGDRAAQIARGTNSVKGPEEETTRFIQGQEHMLPQMFGSEPKNSDMELFASMERGKSSDQQSPQVRDYLKSKMDWQLKKNSLMDSFATYQTSQAAKNHVTFQQYLKNPNGFGTPADSTSTPSGNGKQALPF